MKALVAKEVDSKLIIDFKQAVCASLESHQGTTEQQRIALMCCFLDPRFKALRFLSSSERRDMYTSVLTATEELYCKQHESPPSTKRTKTKPDAPHLDIKDQVIENPPVAMAAARFKKNLMSIRLNGRLTRAVILMLVAGTAELFSVAFKACSSAFVPTSNVCNERMPI